MALGSIGKYEKLDILGHGVSGIVYLAWDTLLGKHVALKEVSLQAADEARFLEEARVLDRLRHPNIVRVNSVDKIDGRLVIDMEYVKGTNLHELMRQRGKLAVPEALSIAVQICDALDFAHKNRAVHRDIKPANVLISYDGQAKIVDFGLAEILGSGSYAGGAGTYAYMAPEDFEEEEHSDHRSDIWSVGVTLYEMLTGRRPFRAAKPKDPFSWKRAVAEAEPLSLSEIDPALPRELEQVVAWALAKDKPDRYQSAGEMAADLRDIARRIGIGDVESALSSSFYRSEDELTDDSYRRVRPTGSRISVTPDMLDFGKVRRGESRNLSMMVRVPGRGRTAGRVAVQPGWIQVSPQAFDRRKQVIEVTADTESIWEPGLYNDRLVLEVDGENLEIPASVDVLPARRQFYEVAWWYIPLLMLCLLPVVSRGIWSKLGSVDSAALVTMGLLSAMLFVVTVAADLGILEKLVPALIAAIGLGALVGTLKAAFASGTTLSSDQVLAMSLVGTPLSLFVALQLLTASRWRLWAVAVAIMSVCASIVLTR